MRLDIGSISACWFDGELVSRHLITLSLRGALVQC